MAEVPGVDRVWVGLPTRAGWLYLAVVQDLKSRAVVDWQTNDTREAILATDALAQALWRRKPQPGLLHHSDRGVQYTSAEYQGLLQQHGIRCSMSRKRNCWDHDSTAPQAKHAVAESFFATFGEGARSGGGLADTRAGTT